MGQFLQFRARHVAKIKNLLTVCTWLSSDDPPSKNCPHIGGTIAVDVVDYKLLAAVDPENPRKFDEEAGFFPGFPHCRICWNLFRLDQSSGQHPDSPVGMQTHQDPSLIVV